MTGLAATLPPEQIRIATDPHSLPFWEAARDGWLTAQQCASCGAFRMPPTPFCPECLSQDVRWPELSGRATVFSFSVVRGLPGDPDLILIPVVLELEGAPGVHLVSNIIDATPEDVTIGAEVSVDFVEISDGWRLPVFRLSGR
jgi:uncharacterized protein